MRFTNRQSDGGRKPVIQSRAYAVSMIASPTFSALVNLSTCLETTQTVELSFDFENIDSHERYKLERLVLARPLAAEPPRLSWRDRGLRGRSDTQSGPIGRALQLKTLTTPFRVHDCRWSRARSGRRVVGSTVERQLE